MGGNNGDVRLSSYEILKQAYLRLAENAVSRINLGGEVTVEIATENLCHSKPRIVSMCYESADIVRLDGKCFAISLGAIGGNPIRKSYNGDILALEVPASREAAVNSDELIRSIERSSYFKQSLVCAMHDGTLKVDPKSIFNNVMSEKISGTVSGFIVKDPGEAYISYYKPEFVGVLAGIFEDVLRGN